MKASFTYSQSPWSKRQRRKATFNIQTCLDETYPIAFKSCFEICETAITQHTQRTGWGLIFSPGTNTSPPHTHNYSYSIFKTLLHACNLLNCLSKQYVPRPLLIYLHNNPHELWGVLWGCTFQRNGHFWWIYKKDTVCHAFRVCSCLHKMHSAITLFLNRQIVWPTHLWVCQCFSRFPIFLLLLFLPRILGVGEISITCFWAFSSLALIPTTWSLLESVLACVFCKIALWLGLVKN